MYGNIHHDVMKIFFTVFGRFFQLECIWGVQILSLLFCTNTQFGSLLSLKVLDVLHSHICLHNSCSAGVVLLSPRFLLVNTNFWCPGIK